MLGDGDQDKLLWQLMGTQSSNQTSNYVLQKSFSQLGSGYEEIKGHQNLSLPSSSSFWKSSTQGDYAPIALSSLLQTAPVPSTKQPGEFQCHGATCGAAFSGEDIASPLSLGASMPP